MLTATEARELISGGDIIWYQKFELVPGVVTPGTNDIGYVLDEVEVPLDLSGASVLDIGTANGGAAFLAERRGAARVVASDLYDDRWFGFAKVRDALGSKVEYVQCSVYELPWHPAIAGERFDVVLFLGVLYHLRHPLLALDNLRLLASGNVYMETSISDAVLAPGSPPVARFYRGDELNRDPSNWFSPNLECLLEWCRSSGLEAAAVRRWPEENPMRAGLRLAPVPGRAEWQAISYERPLQVVISPDAQDG